MPKKVEITADPVDPWVFCEGALYAQVVAVDEWQDDYKIELAVNRLRKEQQALAETLTLRFNATEFIGDTALKAGWLMRVAKYLALLAKYDESQAEALLKEIEWFPVKDESE